MVCFSRSRSERLSTWPTSSRSRTFGWSLLLVLPLALANATRLCSAVEPSWLGLGTPKVSSEGVWTDWIIAGQWRIQRHNIIGHYRLLDPNEHRIAFGNLQQCYGEFQRRRELGQIGNMPRQVVLCLHGLRGSRDSMLELGQYLEQQAGYVVIHFGYASTQASVQEHALALESVLRNLRDVDQIHIVAHSLGNIVVRHLLYKLHVQGKPLSLSIHRMVMISPPNHGAELADTVGQLPLTQLLMGEVVDQLSPKRGWSQLEKQLATPDFEFGIIAGGRGNDLGYTQRIGGDDDGVLSLETHQLADATDFVQTVGLHQAMPQLATVHQATLRFLQWGTFKESSQPGTETKPPQPIRE